MKTPILLITFNRYEETRQVLDKILEQQPEKLYVSSDGPRKENLKDALEVKKIRDYIVSLNIPTNIETLFQDTNLGCGLGVSSAISWFFSHEEQGIILEDDCLPSEDFFTFCSDMLERYKYDSRISMITGTNQAPNKLSSKPYYFSDHFIIWGWATWRRAWADYDFHMKDWPSEEAKNFLKYRFSKKIYDYLTYTFNQNQYLDTWDIAWVYSCLMQSRLCLTPKVNLISNIGVYGVHGQGVSESHFLKTESIKNNEYQGYFPKVRVEVPHDVALHEKFSFKKLKLKLVVQYLKNNGILNYLKPFSKMFKKIFY